MQVSFSLFRFLVLVVFPCSVGCRALGKAPFSFWISLKFFLVHSWLRVFFFLYRAGRRPAAWPRLAQARPSKLALATRVQVSKRRIEARQKYDEKMVHIAGDDHTDDASWK